MLSHLDNLLRHLFIKQMSYEDLAQLPKQLFIMNSECPRRTS